MKKNLSPEHYITIFTKIFFVLYSVILLLLLLLFHSTISFGLILATLIQKSLLH